MHKATLHGTSFVEYFRGVNFHVKVLTNAKTIQDLIPSFSSDDKPFQLSTVEDSVKLGQAMIDHGILKVLVAERNHPMNSSETTPRMVLVLPESRGGDKFTEKGLYSIVDNTSQNTQMIYLGLMIFVILALMCFRLWPLWLKKVIWYISFYLLVFLVVTAFLRLILWGILYHFGLEFWLFPNYFIDSNDPRDSFLPVYSFEVREDQMDVGTTILRLISGSLLVYMCW